MTKKQKKALDLWVSEISKNPFHSHSIFSLQEFDNKTINAEIPTTPQDQNVLSTRNLFPHPARRHQHFLELTEDYEITKNQQIVHTDIKNKLRKHNKNIFWTIKASLGKRKILFLIFCNDRFVSKFSILPNLKFRMPFESDMLTIESKIQINSFNKKLLNKEFKKIYDLMIKIILSKKFRKFLLKK